MAYITVSLVLNALSQSVFEESQCSRTSVTGNNRGAAAGLAVEYGQLYIFGISEKNRKFLWENFFGTVPSPFSISKFFWPYYDVIINIMTSFSIFRIIL